MKTRLILKILLVWLGGMATVVLALQFFPEYLTPPPPPCPAPGAPIYQAAPFQFTEPSAPAVRMETL